MATPEAVAAFQRITGAPEFVAVQKLEEYGGNLNEAINAHFLEGDRHILSGQGKNPAAAPRYNNTGASNQDRGSGSNGILPFLNAARRFRPSLLLDPNYRRELRDLYKGTGGAGGTAYTNRPQPLTSHPAEVRDVPAWINNPFEPHYQPGLGTTGEDLSSHSLGIRGTDGYQNQYPLAQSNASHGPDTETEEAMLQAAIEASKMETRGGSSWERIDVVNNSSNGGLPQTLQQEDDDLARAIASSLETAEQEKNSREKEGQLGGHFLLDKGKKTNSSRNQLELGTSSDENVVQDVAQPVSSHLSIDSAGGHSQQNEDVFLSNKWGGISAEEINEALLVETALFGEISTHSVPSLPNLQHRPKETQCMSTSMSQLLTDSRLLKQQQDADYLASLRADKQKELNSFNNTESQSSREEESCKKMLEEKELMKILDKKKLRLSKEPLLSDEVVTIVVRMPDGGRCERRFLKTDKLELLFDFIDVSGAQKPGTYRFVKSYPRRAYSINDCSSTFNEVGLNKSNEALFLELI
ncbi:hypothetical protein VIGAN_09145100 [Vigna angularis var. angularis]|uniref:UBX domain-containing protein n=1 Tax=Vigna angularis var. angularis TaxID=157739 RepID=A0A0S3SYX7_PHAAN|nr:plant UBX domain-containing protein 9 isoform X1 [Vigna angularis]BAT97874.1 hypothetical protein VIGAN_09145100 [Vigna angularis var. angularis]